MPQINENILEPMDQVNFKSWFVDVDPVYTKMKGRDYHLPPKIMDLFPDELEESALGLIPKRWEISKLGKISKTISCLHSKKPKKDQEQTGNILLQLSNISENGLLDLSDIYWINNSDYRNVPNLRFLYPGKKISGLLKLLYDLFGKN